MRRFDIIKLLKITLQDLSVKSPNTSIPANKYPVRGILFAERVNELLHSRGGFEDRSVARRTRW